MVSIAAMLVACPRCGFAVEPVTTSAKQNATQPGVDLLATDARNDWIHKHAGAAGWTVADGVLSGGMNSTPLVSTYALGDFELQVDWKVAEGTTLKLGFPQTAAGEPKSQPVEIYLAEQPGISIRLPEGAKILKVDPQLQGKTHRTIIRRSGDRLTLDCDGTKSRELPVAAGEKFGLTLAIDGGGANGRAAVESLRLVESNDATAPKP
jgi:hypothetical protein